MDSFKEITGCDNDEEAQHFMDASNGNLEQAINLFFTEASRREFWNNATNASSSTSRGRRGAQNGVSRSATVAADDNDISMIDLSDDDDNDAVASSQAFEDEVRAPIAPIQGPIVEQSFQQTYGNFRRGPSNPIFEQYHDFRQIAEEQEACLRRQQRAAAATPSLHANNSRRRVNDVDDDDGDVVDVYDDESEPNGGAVSSRTLRSMRRLHGRNDADASAPSSSSSRDLKTLFRPPIDLIYKDNWDRTLLEARKRRHWLLVNVQMAQEFACQVLNRDIWSDATVKEIVKSNFVFWQVYHDSPDGVRVRSYYNCDEFPAIFVVDPRTGEEVLKLKAKDSISFLDQLTAFMDENPTFEARDTHIASQAAQLTNAVAAVYPKYFNGRDNATSENGAPAEKPSDSKINGSTSFTASSSSTGTNTSLASASSSRSARKRAQSNRQPPPSISNDMEMLSNGQPGEWSNDAPSSSSSYDTADNFALQAKRMKRIMHINDDIGTAVGVSHDQRKSDKSFCDDTNDDDELGTSADSGNTHVDDLDEVGEDDPLMVSADEWRNHVGDGANGGHPATVMLRLPDGQRDRLSMWSTTPLKALFLYIAGRGVSRKCHSLVLSFPKRVFNATRSHQRLSLADAGFAKQEVVDVEKL